MEMLKYTLAATSGSAAWLPMAVKCCPPRQNDVVPTGHLTPALRAPHCIHPVQIAPNLDRYRRLLPRSGTGT